MPALYFVRHGETDFNVAKRLQGHYDTSLNARGRQQAAECAVLIGGLLTRDGRAARDLDYVSSPLQRARQTMEIIRGALDLEPDAYTLDGRLVEISYGEWEGMTLQEIEARDPDVLNRREEDKWDFAPPGGECYRDVAKRVAEWYAAIGRDTVVVAHGGVARALMANLGILPDEEATHADISQGVIYVFAGGTLACYA
jgi:broad specificity phosphatase PhoE